MIEAITPPKRKLNNNLYLQVITPHQSCGWWFSVEWLLFYLSPPFLTQWVTSHHPIKEMTPEKKCNLSGSPASRAVEYRVVILPPGPRRHPRMPCNSASVGAACRSLWNLRPLWKWVLQ